MGRVLKRVPLDFDYPMYEIWYGYFINSPQLCMEEYTQTGAPPKYCDQCKRFAKIKGIEIAEYGCPNYDEYLKDEIESIRKKLEVPTGVGYQLWETTSEGSPISPPFAFLEDLAEWCETNATMFGSSMLSKEQWLIAFERMKEDDDER